MEAWETAALDTLTPRQRRQREIRSREDAIARELGVREGSTSLWTAIAVLARDEASVFDLANAVELLDRDTHSAIDSYSRADRMLPRIGAAEPDPESREGRILRRRREEAGLALDVLDEQLHSAPHRLVRQRLIDRLIEHGVQLPQASQLRCAEGIVTGLRALWTARWTRNASAIEYWRATLADYGIREDD